MPQSSHFTGPLYSRMADDLQLAGMSQRTHDGYLRAVRQLADFCQTHPSGSAKPSCAAISCTSSARSSRSGSLRVAFSGIKFFYTRTCQRPWATLAQMKVQQVKSLPEVLTIAQVRQIIDAATTQRIAVYFWTVYSLGLRMQEGLNLQVGDIDAARGMVHVHRGKGAKDRYVPLPTATLQLLREYWLTHRHRRLLFPADGRDHQGSSTAATPMSPTAVQGAMKKITTQIDFGKKVSIHTLRHSYGTHLLGSGRELAGHSAVPGSQQPADHDGLPAPDRLGRRRHSPDHRATLPPQLTHDHGGGLPTAARTGLSGEVRRVDSLRNSARCSRRSPVAAPASWAASLYHCDDCGRAHWVGRSCGNRHCPTCGRDKTERLARRNKPAACCRCITSWSPSRCPTSCACVLRAASRGPAMRRCSPRQRHAHGLGRPLEVSDMAAGSASSACCTRGDAIRRSIIRTSTSSFPAAE